MDSDIIFMILFILVLLFAIYWCKTKKNKIQDSPKEIENLENNLQQDSSKDKENNSENNTQNTRDIAQSELKNEEINIDDTNKTIEVEQIIIEPKETKIQENKNQEVKDVNYIFSSDKPVSITTIFSPNKKYLLDATNGFKVIRLSDNVVIYNVDYSSVQNKIVGQVKCKLNPDGNIVLYDDKNNIWVSGIDSAGPCTLSQHNPFYMLSVNNDGSLAIVDSKNNYIWWTKYDKEYYKNVFPGTTPALNFWKKGFYK